MILHWTISAGDIMFDICTLMYSCAPNLINYEVLVESMDCQLAHIGFFANRDVSTIHVYSNYCYFLITISSIAS